MIMKQCLNKVKYVVGKDIKTNGYSKEVKIHS